MIFNLFKKKNTKSDVSILYGSHSGNSKHVAHETSKILRKQGIVHECRNLHDFSIEELTELKFMFLVVSTHGEGDPPPAARELYNYLHQKNVPPLKQLRYSICALGDSSYTNFCKTGIDIDKRLNYLGGMAVINRVDCDYDYNKNASEWIQQVVSYLKGDYQSLESKELPNIEEKKFIARIKSKERINHPLSDKEVFHLEISVWDRTFHYNPGDTVGILPKNPEHLVREVLKTVLYKNVKTIINLDQYQSKFNQLLCNYEITRLNADTIKKYNKLVKNKDLKHLIEDKNELEKFIKGSNILTLLVLYPYPITIDQLTGILPSLRPRKYSVASSIKRHPQEVHLTVRTIGYSNHRGACTHYLNHHLKTNDQLEIEVVSNYNFHLDTSKQNPVMMIATGAGIAPFRGFLEELEAVKSKRKTWLIFGERNRKYDKLYHDELSNYFKKKVLGKMDLAFSRGASKCYVQDILRDSKDEVFDWISNGAEIFICGSSAMGRGVKKVFEEILKDNGQELNQLIKEKRYKEECF